MRICAIRRLLFMATPFVMKQAFHSSNHRMKVWEAIGNRFCQDQLRTDI